MMRSFALPAFFLACLLTFPLVASATDNLVGTARAPFGFEGSLTDANAEWLASFDVPLKPTGGLHAESARLTVSENRYPVGVMFSGPRVGTSRDLVGPKPPDMRTLRDVSATLVVATPDARWHLAAGNLTSLQAEGACRFSHARTWDPEALEAVRRTMVDAPGLVHASCDVTSVSIEGPLVWKIWNTTLLLRFRDAAGTWRFEELATGDRVEPNPMVPGAFDRVIRSATLQTLTSRSIASWKGDAHLEAQSPAFFATGALELPLESHLTWNDRVYENEIVMPAPQGSFRVFADEGLQVAGRTMNAPHVPTTFPPLAAQAAATILAALIALGWALYARMGREDILSHPARRALVDFLQENPGATLRELNAVAPGSRSALLHHLRRLRSNGYVAQRPVGRVMLYALRQDEPRLHEPEFLAQRMKRHELVCLIIAQEPNVSQSELAKRLGVTQSYVSRIISDLIREGRVERVGTGARRAYRLVSRPGETPAPTV